MKSKFPPLAKTLCAALLFGAGLFPFAAMAQTKLIVQLGTPAITPMSIDLYVAEKAGFFKEEGLNVEVRNSPNASQAAQILGSGGADIGRFSWEPLLQGYDKGLHGKIFYALYTHFMYYAAVPADSTLKTIADLRGKKIGVTNMGSASIVVLRSMLRNAGLPPDDVTLLPVSVGAMPMAALKMKQVDALMLYDSYYSTVEAEGMKLRFIRHPVIENFGNNGYVATDKTIAEKSDALGHYARAIAKATTFIFANPEAAVHIYWQVNPSAKGSDEAASMQKALKELKSDMEAINVANAPGQKFGAVDLPAFKTYMQMMVQDGGVPKAIPVEDLATDKFVAFANDFDVKAVQAKAQAWK